MEKFVSDKPSNYFYSKPNKKLDPTDLDSLNNQSLLRDNVIVDAINSVNRDKLGGYTTADENKVLMIEVNEEEASTNFSLINDDNIQEKGITAKSLSDKCTTTRNYDDNSITGIKVVDNTFPLSKLRSSGFCGFIISDDDDYNYKELPISHESNWNIPTRAAGDTKPSLQPLTAIWNAQIDGSFSAIKLKDIVSSLSQEDRLEMLPVGYTMEWDGDDLPSDNWCDKDGRSLNKNDTPVLFSILGYKYGGAGDNYNIPDDRGITKVGFYIASNQPTAGKVNQGVGNFDKFDVGGVGGQESVVLTEQQIPAHSHALTILGGTGAGINFPFAKCLANNPAYNYTSTTNSSGGGQLHNNMQPSRFVRWIYKIK